MQMIREEPTGSGMIAKQFRVTSRDLETVMSEFGKPHCLL
jgi:hypothetical protein